MVGHLHADLTYNAVRSLACSRRDAAADRESPSTITFLSVRRSGSADCGQNCPERGSSEMQQIASSHGANWKYLAALIWERSLALRAIR